MEIAPFFRLMVDKKASDLFFSVGAPPNIKIEGVNSPIGQEPLTPSTMSALVFSILNDAQQKEFELNKELNIALSLNELGRFRINVFRQRGEMAMVIRYIKGTIPSIEDLGLPPVLKSIVMEMRGLVLVVGSTGSGKSTTLASMLDYRNDNYRGHILTIEDPIEYLHKHKKSIVDQREVGIDTLSYDSALQNAMREAPDAILIGEIRDRNAMKHAIAYSETGHLCISTLHANNANQALDRVVNFFPEDVKTQVLMDLSLNLKAIISMRLVPGINKQRIAAVEILMNTPYISDLIEKGKIDEMKEAMARGREQGMQTFDQELIRLYNEGKISQENAVKFADSKNNVGLEIRLHEDKAFDFSNENLTIQSDENNSMFRRPQIE